ncbi:unnamed protein product [Chironomus riparius]|uniref:Uncharacterized protein n=1 Tax=Chironomus riparius TaxID=315576 RepID=A0A9N9SA94_9DIPT|nr:unnamed protein product [Chironomus riparius]
MTEIGSCFKSSLCGGSTASITPRDLIIHGQATDILSEFSATTLVTLQDLSDHLNEIARHRDDSNFKMLNKRALKSGDNLKNATKQKLEIAFRELLEKLANLVDIDPEIINNVLNNSPILSRDVARIQEFIKTGKLLYDSANNVVDGKDDEFLIHIMNKSQAENVKFNLSGC